MLASTFTLCVLISANLRLVLDLRQVSRSDDLSTTRVGREVDRAIRALPHTHPRRSRSRSTLVFADEDESEWPTSSDSAGEPGPSSPRRADVESGVVLGWKGKGRMESNAFELGTFDTFSEETETRNTA